MSKNGLILLTPTSIEYSGTSATVGANGSVLFSAVSSLQLNGVFTTDYDNYQIVCRMTGSNGNILGNLITGGVPSNTGYTYQTLEANGTSVLGNRGTYTSYISGTASSIVGGFVEILYGPYLAQPTAIRVVGIWGDSSGRINDMANTHNVSTAYDSVKYTASGGNMTGRIAVYGMRK